MISLARALVLAFACVPTAYAFSQEIVYATSLGPVTLEEGGRLVRPPAGADEDVRPPHVIEHEDRRRYAMQFGRGYDAPLLPRAVPTIALPPIATAFSATGSSFYAPADASGAVSRDYLVAATNDQIVIHTKKGDLVSTTRIDLFMRDIPNDTTVEYYDPRVAYDRLRDRWVMMCIRDQEHVMIAASRSSDPRGTWDRYRVSVPGADFSNLALTRDSALFATREFGELSVVLSVRKTDLYGRLPILPATSYEFGGLDVTPVTNEDSGDEYALEYYGNMVRIARLATGTRRDVQLPQPGSIVADTAPQLGTNVELNTGYVYAVEHAVLRDGELHGVHGVNLGARAGVMWWKVDLASNTLLDSTLFEDPSPQVHYAYPSLGVNRAGAVVIGFSTFGSAQYVSAGYVYRDPQGRVSPTGVVRIGEGPITNTDRWGDYTTTIVDPYDDNSFWTLQIYAMRNRWVTYWAQVKTNSSAPPAKHRAVRH